MLRISAMTLAVTCITGVAFAAPPSPRETLRDARRVLEDLSDKEKAIPAKLLQEAQAVVIVPNTIKAGLGIGGQLGHGVAVIKDKQGGWGEIRFVDLGGASVGFQIGVQSTDVVLVFKNRKGLDRILDGKAKLKLGADAAVSAGPLGRDAAIATDLLLKSEIFSYSRSRGLFAGVSLDGVVLTGEGRRTAEFEKDTSPITVKEADELKKTIAIHAAEKSPMHEPKRDPYPQPMPGPQPLPVPPPTVNDLPPPLAGASVSNSIAVSTKGEEPTGPVRRFFRRLRGN